MLHKWITLLACNDWQYTVFKIHSVIHHTLTSTFFSYYFLLAFLSFMYLYFYIFFSCIPSPCSLLQSSSPRIFNSLPIWVPPFPLSLFLFVCFFLWPHLFLCCCPPSPSFFSSFLLHSLSPLPHPHPPLFFFLSVTPYLSLLLAPPSSSYSIPPPCLPPSLPPSKLFFLLFLLFFLLSNFAMIFRHCVTSCSLFMFWK